MWDTEVLVVGAGPTGLVLALWLTRLGVRVRLVDRSPHRADSSRAVAVQPRTLELYRQLGLDVPVVEAGLPFSAINLWVRGERRARAEIGAMGEGLSPFPYVIIYPQDQHETLLIERLAAAGVRVDRPAELVGLADRGDHVAARLRHADGTTEEVTAGYVAGCDGGHSFVRQALGIGFPGGTYAHVFYVADVEAEGPQMNGELHVALDDADFLACFPLQAHGRGRLIGSVPAHAVAGGAKLEWRDIDSAVAERIRLTVTRVSWFSTYHVHHRVATSFRSGRVFLLGDAAHIHSPVGGQGMNTGIGDAVNLAWKLAAVLQGRAGPALLDSYADERIPFARRLVQTTDRGFELVTASGPIARFVRLHLAPRLLATAFRFALLRRFFFETLSQIRVSYRGAGLSEGHAGAVEGGDRLPWVPRAGGKDNFAPLSSLAWQVHVYGGVPAGLGEVCAARNLPLHLFPYDPAAERAGLARDALYLVRPDGYVGLAAAADAAQTLERYLDARALRPRAAAPA